MRHEQTEQQKCLLKRRNGQLKVPFELHNYSDGKSILTKDS